MVEKTFFKFHLDLDEIANVTWEDVWSTHLIACIF